MSTFFISESNKPNNNGHYSFFGQSDKIRPHSSVPVGNYQFGNVVVDNEYADKSLSDGIFAYNNNKPVSSRSTFKLSDTNNLALSHMSNTSFGIRYPGQQLFGAEYRYQYLYSSNIYKHRIGVF